jgi:hypothetical protein
MITYITPIEQLEKEATEIQNYLTITCSEDPNEIIERGNDLAVYLARTGKMLADSKYWQDEAVKNSTLEELGKAIKIPPSILKELISASTKKENYLVNWITRLNSSCTHQLDWLRSVLSKAKEEMRLQGYQSKMQ